MPFPRASQALSRFTVLDLTRVRSGPTCVRQLADWGANVIKIDALLEDAGGEQPGGPRRGSDFQNLHRNKRAMTLNLKDPEGLEVFKRLAAKADVVVENFRPDVKAKLGIDYESLRQINPRIVYGSISGFGQDGPYHKRPGFDQIAQGMGGLMSITGAPGGGPLEEPRRAQRRDQCAYGQADQRGLGRAVQRGGRTLRPDLLDRPGLC